MNKVEIEINRIRNQIINSTLLILSYFLVLVLIFVLLRINQFGLHPLFLIQISGLVIVATLIIFRKKIAPRLKFHLLASVFLGLGFAGIYYFGISGGYILCFIGIILATIGYGRKAGLWYALFTLCSIGFIGFLHSHHQVNKITNLENYNSSALTWFNLFLTGLFLIALIIQSIGKFYNYFHETIMVLNKNMEELEKSNLALMQNESILEENNEKLLKLNEQISQAKLNVDLSEARLKAAQALAHVGNWEYDLRLDKLSWSEEAGRILGNSSSMREGKLECFFRYIFPDDNTFVSSSYDNHLKTNDLFNIIHRVLLNDGSIRYVNIQCCTELDAAGNPLLSTGTIADITNQMNIRKQLMNAIEKSEKSYLQLQKRNEEYEKVNEELSKTNLWLLQAKERAEESDKLKTAFLNNISHEIRTPMNGILGFSDAILDETIPMNKRLKYRSYIEESTTRLLDVITDLLDLSKIQTNQLVVFSMEIKITKLFDELKNKFETKCHEKGISLFFEIEGDENDTIISDNYYLHRILIHLVDNAVKFTSTGAVIVKYSQNEQECVFSVEDTGIGIPEEMIPKIFEPFRQVEVGQTRDYGGNGVGLSIVKGIVDALGGRIRLTSQLEKGTKFSVHFNADVSSKSFRRKIEGKRNIADLTILIADDEFFNYEYLKLVITAEGSKVLWAQNGEEAIQIALKQKPDLILMDIKMPIKDGIAATKAIRLSYPELPIIAISAYTFGEDVDRAMEAGCETFLSKPIKKKVLIETIQELIK